ncbi:DNA polymerase [Oryzisolibacter propanilivorax]|uniref:DNA polymerase n=1 Tax=Oryzisolibacter propanilivorax TaxID=1527607 RepID=A0A1G9Q5T1_9BURK|nr:hypothetical protein [Oryzisolibacter propanilivorax]SDM06368.1 DNA polymerase [Oryzisolibacter propanilivorax]
MTLSHLDARQRAMLQEMGIALPLLQPARAERGAPPAAAGPADAAPVAAAPLAEEARAGARRPAGTPVSDAPPPAPAQQQPAAPAAARPADAAPAPVGEVLLGPLLAPYAQQDVPAPATGGWLVLLECAQPGDPLAGDAGRLLHHMLRAMGLHHQPCTQLAALLPSSAPASAPGRPLAQVLAERQPCMVLLLGLGAARAVLGSPQPLARLRARPHRLADGTPAAVSHDPAYLLLAPQAKAGAWLDLCRALARVRPDSTAPG